MEGAEQRDPLEQRVDGSAFAVQKEIEVVKIFSWKPGKVFLDLMRRVGEKATDTFSDAESFEDLEIDSEEYWESDGEDSSVPTTSTTSPEMKVTPQHEKEDWDAEVADTENRNNPYDFDDIIHCGDCSAKDQAAPYSVQGHLLYDPSLHHVAPLTLKHIEAVLVDGQFDDAVD
ncbi:coordinator of PRMT5 and differentiation stimulator [Anolis carolinensis]|uniref:coordinator of PRMT5 and differentiation stimulator n=1 Tax=Anolis carolinensis TaxID=28377 RepID=UPI0007DB6C8C|nr:PREDICTED: coordinator of PRMT5 and differentiation stimulator [Anolis carolinensis]XP_016850462.1 PREDICTED: coordinator of PRMT5 and differentiation stimulator [Anolis carolinensis]|eukprot:XP_008112588.2 PREDICTED: coordinator of PRMT5 and differentiation stimulator [Anolis carolinensis]